MISIDKIAQVDSIMKKKFYRPKIKYIVYLLQEIEGEEFGLEFEFGKRGIQCPKLEHALDSLDGNGFDKKLDQKSVKYVERMSKESMIYLDAITTIIRLKKAQYRDEGLVYKFRRERPDLTSYTNIAIEDSEKVMKHETINHKL